MRCAVNDLSRLATANVFTLWHYETDVGFSVMDVGYFNTASEMFNAGDLIIATHNQKGMEEKATQFLIVAKIENGEVTVRKM